MIDAAVLTAKFAAGEPYEAYVGKGTADQRERWAGVAGRVRLTAGQATLVQGFTRKVNVLVISGLWCGDCAAQCPMIAAIARANPSVIDLRFVDRDEHIDLSNKVKICGGNRVPTAIFMTEDFDFLGIAGDKTLSRLRAMAAKALGASCPLPGAPLPDDELAATTQDWVNEFERAHLIARLSPRLRQRHGD